MPEIEFDGKRVWYSVHGTGEHAVLVLPGAIGTVKSDFDVQLNPANAHCFDFFNFKWVFVEMHGWGQLNQERVYDPNILETDADYCHYIMQSLGCDQYSIYAWSEGAKVALLLAHRLGPEIIRSVVAQSVIPYQSPTSTKHFMWSRNVHNWDPAVLSRYSQAYDGDLQKVSILWNTHMDYIEAFEEYFPDGILGTPEEGLQQIQCPVLVIHGEKDFFVELEQSKHVSDNIPGAKLVIFPNGLHNLHQIDTLKLKKVVEDFLSKN